ncbi:hypothetical protein JL722_11549 [Aureococcus anophagefferens]|nr:hypothetical protein JL722_11549 [Aureococcus anophagefferens]
MPVLTDAWGYSDIVSPTATSGRRGTATRTALAVARGPRSRDVAQYPDCAEFYTAFNSSDIGALFSYFNGNLHGPMHILTGGLWGDDPKKERDLDLWFEDERHVTAYKELLPNVLLMAKFLWRQGYLTCPTFCSRRQRSGLRARAPRTFAGWDYEEFWHRTGLRNVTDRTFHFGDWNIPSLTKAVCHVGHVGDSFSSAASQDPIFWGLYFADFDTRR